MTPLKVPFSEKDQVKKLGARWNPDLKCWYVPDGVGIDPFSNWIPSKGKKPKDAVSLSDLLFNISNVINTSFDKEYWVRAEVSNISSGNHTYLDLVEFDDNKREIAKSRATIWHADSEEIFDKFRSKTMEDITIGITVLVLVKVNFHPQYGLSLNIIDIDPTYTIGAMQAKINEIINKLKDDGVFDNNYSTHLPEDFTNIAVISPESAAGLGDFRAEADLLANSGICKFTYYSATFQGQTASGSIVAAFEKLENDNLKKKFDAIVIIRGGGSKSDLHFVNEYEIARCITDTALPVMVGIGHEQDSSVLDLIAKASFDTPSKVINHIFNTVINNALTADENYKIIIRHSESLVKLAESIVVSTFDSIKSTVEISVLEAQNIIIKNYEDIKNNATVAVNISEQVINERYHSLLVTANNITDLQKEKIQGIIKSVLLSSPITNLSKGYTITKKKEIYISSCTQLSEGDALEVTFKDGTVNTTVSSINTSTINTNLK
jgi:exodeoxyribonuclease VII large subunit